MPHGAWRIRKLLDCENTVLPLRVNKKARIGAGLICLKWWRRGELNPRPQALDFRIYARSCLFFSHPSLPEQQGRRQTSDGIS
jgi:hypothetical protein